MGKEMSIKSNFVFNALYQITNILVPIVTMPYLSRVLQADGVGEYSYGYSIAFYFYTFIRLGLQNYGNRSIAYAKKDKIKLSKTFCELYVFQFFMGIVISAIYLIYVLFGATEKKLAAVFFLIVIAGVMDVTWFMYGMEEFKITSVRDIIVKLITMALIFRLVKTSDDVTKYSLIISGGFLVSQLIVIPLVVKKIDFVKPTIGGIKKHIKPNLLLFLPTVAVNIYKVMDKIMLGAMSTEAELGYYHSTENIIKVPLAFITALGVVMLPRMSSIISGNGSEQKLESIFEKSIIFAMFISSSICCGLMTVAKEFVPIFYGDGFEKCISLFYIILPSCIFVAFANVIRTQYILPHKMDHLFVGSLFVGAGINFIVNLLCIPHYASIGAAMGTLAAEIAVFVVQAICVFKEANIGRNILNSIPFIIAGVLMFILFSQFTPNVSNGIIALIFKIFICGSFYLIVLACILGFKRIVGHSDKF